MHTTSLTIKQDIFMLMQARAEEMNISVSGLIKRLIARFSKCYTTRLEYRECNVTYQPSIEECHLFIITYSDEEYEQVLDIRKVWKLSVSFFVLMAFLHYLYCESTGDSAQSRKGLLYSYMVTNYVFRKILDKGNIVFMLIWAKKHKPQKPE